MVEGDLKLDRCLIAVGDLGPTAGGDLARLAGEYEIRMAGCEDSYAAVAELAARPARSTLVVGHLVELTRENGAFFSIAARNGARCCCLRKPDGPSDHEDVIAAIHAGVYLVSGNGDLTAAVEDWLAREARRVDPPLADYPLRHDEEFRATDAELNALLEPEMDG
jgi:hypothetical protein